mmetsp:Transcript_7018/g.12640  ORF Transcript_7018/g.12640 Transcript_7018/m.12640 type:complete len:227 (-) Transcript_7018:860-1540(-)
MFLNVAIQEQCHCPIGTATATLSSPSPCLSAALDTCTSAVTTSFFSSSALANWIEAASLSRASSKCSSTMVIGGKKRMTLACTPQVNKISPLRSASSLTHLAKAGFHVLAWSSPSPSGAVMNSTATMRPGPRTSAICCTSPRIDSSLFFSFAPRTTARSQSFSSSMTSRTAWAAAIPRGFPANVPPRPPGSAESIISAFPVTADKGRPPASPLAMVVRSANTPASS